MSEMKHQVVIQLRGSSKPVSSPLWELDRAEQELGKVREAQTQGRLVDASWLSVHGSNVLSASVEPLLPAAAKRAA